MGIARLLAKGWIFFCLFAGAHAVRLALISGMPPASSVAAITICAGLFMAMGLLFVGGFGASVAHFAPAHGESWPQRLRPHHLLPGFDEAVFTIFVVLSFLNQAFVAPNVTGNGGAGALEAAIAFLVPGQRALVDSLESCAMVGGRSFAAAFTWLLAIIYLGSTVSRLKLAAGLIRLEAGDRPQLLGPTLRAFLFGIVAIVGIQFLAVGSAYPWFDCGAYTDTDITGAVLIGLAPLMLAYLIVAALASLLASSPES
jgi:hypothetical protein